MPIRAEQLASLPLFANLEPHELLDIAACCSLGRAQAGATLIAEGRDEKTPLYVLIQGRVRTSKLGVDGRRHAMSELLAPAIFGEMDVLADRPPLSSVVALTAVRYARLSQERIAHLCEQESTSILKVLENLTTALRYRNLATEARLRGPTGCSARVGPLQRMLHAGWAPRACV